MTTTELSNPTIARTRGDLPDLLRSLGADPSRLVFHDELTDLRNRRFLKSYFEQKVRWRSGEDFPISLLVLDIDHFKRVNDARGHDVGDRALVWVAELLRETVGDDGIPVRYAGDEFVVVLPGRERDAALEIAERLVAASRRRPFRPPGPGGPVALTISVGVASAPDDASDAQDLFQVADQALYQSKDAGRDRATSAAELEADRIFQRTALHQLRDAGLGGREEEFLVISRGLDDLRRGRSRFLLFEGEAGMGKTSLLEAVADRIASDAAYRVARAGGDRREDFHPFSLARRLLIDLLRSVEDGGAGVLDALDDGARRSLEALLPEVRGEAGGVAESDSGGDGSGPKGHGGILDALAETFRALAGSTPLVLLVDDLHFADEATLLLLDSLIRGEGTVLVVSGALDPPRGAEDPETPLERFLDARSKELGVGRTRLRPLSGEDVGLHLQKLFPGIRTPLGFADEIARITGGNPLFVDEVVRELVADRKISIRDSRWTAERLDPGYLPRSVDEILRRRIGRLPVEDRELLERAAAIGEGTPLSVLVGSSHEDEGRVLDFLDRAEALGLLRLDSRGDEEVLRFLGKRIQEVSYEAIDERRRVELHEQIGAYGEELYERAALPSASLPAWQYERAGNVEKADRFRRIRRREALRVFDPQGALDSIGELVESDETAEEPLDPDSVPRLTPLIRAFTKAVRDVQLYPANSRTVVDSARALHETIGAILVDNDRLHLGHSRGALLVNGRRMPLADAASQADAFVTLLSNVELQGVTFLPGVDEHEVLTLVATMGTLRKDVVSPGFWDGVAREEELGRIHLEQVKYTRVVKRRVARSTRRPSIDDGALDAASLERLPRLLRAMQGAVRTSRLYAPDAPATSVAVDRLHEALQGMLEGGRALTLAEVDGTLLVNGRKAEPGTASLAEEVAVVLRSKGIESLSFVPGAPRSEIRTLVGALRDAPQSADGDHWIGVEEALGLRHVHFDLRRFAAPAVGAVVAVPDEEDDRRTNDPVVEEARRRSDESGAALLQTLPGLGTQLLSKGEPAMLRRLLERALEGYASQETMSRELALQACESLFGSLTLGLQHEFAELAIDSFLDALSVESESSVLEILGRLLQGMAGVSIKLGDDALARRILRALEARRRDLSWDPADARARLLDRPLKPAVREILLERLRSDDPQARRRAASVAEAMGPSRLSLFIEVLQTEPDLSVRTVAASLLAEAGSPGAREFSRALANETILERRLRMLEVADTVTTDVRDLLRDALADGDPRIGEAGLRLFERMRRDDLVDLVAPLASGSDETIAAAAIQSLALVGSPSAIEALRKIRRGESRPAVLVACCRALGRLDGTTGIEALVGILRQRRFRMFGPRWDEPVRAAAAAVLREMDDPRARDALSTLTADPHPSVRETALAALEADEPT